MNKEKDLQELLAEKVKAEFDAWVGDISRNCVDRADDILADTDGTKYVHFLGYGYYVGEPDDMPYRIVEYTGFVIPLKVALKCGILKFEAEFGDQYKQYVIDCSEKELHTIYRQYDNGHAPEKIKLCDVSMATPDGMYSVYAEV